MTRWVLLGVLAGGVVLAAYANSFDNEFHFDDSHVIVDNTHLRTVHEPWRFFTDARWFSALPQNATYRPMLSITLAFDAWRGGLSPRPFHVTQVVLLLLLGGALWALFTRLFRDAETHLEPRLLGLWAATFFCVHTGNSQVGNYISSRSEIIAALGVAGAFLLYLAQPGWRRFQLFLVPMVLGALAKTPAVMFAPMLLVYRLLLEEQLSLRDLFRVGQFHRVRRAVLGTIPAFAVAAVTFVGVEKMNPPGQTYGGAGRLEYLWTQAWILIRYVRLFFWPSGLTADTDETILPSAVDPRVIAGALLLVAMLALCFWLSGRSRGGRLAAFGVLWFLLALLPTSSLFPLAEVTNDHRMFFGYIGLCLSAAVFLSQALEGRRIAVLLALAAIAAHTFATRARNEVWRTEESLWADVVAKSPKNGRGLMNYARTLMARGEVAKAKALFLDALKLTPNYSILEVNLGVACAALGQHAEAEQHYLRALQLDPGGVAPNRFYGEWLMGQGRASESRSFLSRAKQLSPSDQTVLDALAVLDALELPFEAERVDAAIAVRGLTPATNDVLGWHALGFELTKVQNFRDAALALARAARLQPDNAAVFNDLGWALGQLGLRDQARSAFERAMSLAPSDERPKNNLRWLEGAR